LGARRVTKHSRGASQTVVAPWYLTYRSNKSTNFAGSEGSRRGEEERSNFDNREHPLLSGRLRVVEKWGQAVVPEGVRLACLCCLPLFLCVSPVHVTSLLDRSMAIVTSRHYVFHTGYLSPPHDILVMSDTTVLRSCPSLSNVCSTKASEEWKGRDKSVKGKSRRVEGEHEPKTPDPPDLTRGSQQQHLLVPLQPLPLQTRLWTCKG
jgi:hypothetical protein